jgi:ubiquinone/menaquinone biosynthesis C-methylase UbiE
LGRRTLQKDHRCLAALLQAGMSVLDIGCGTGAITSGIAKAVAPDGRVVGLDRDEGLLRLARKEHAEIVNLRFERGDAKDLQYTADFDIVTAARTLQWIAEPGDAVRSMTAAAKPSGKLVVLDYSHARNEWKPGPPREFRRFYDAFLAWRQANQWDNEMADHLPGLFERGGLTEIASHVQDEVVERGHADFDERTALWSEVIENVGLTIANAGFCTEAEVSSARESYAPWVRTTLARQTLAMRAVTARVS